MNGNATHFAERAGELRRDFDAGFADPIRVDAIAKQELLAIRIAGAPYAIRLSEISGLFADKKVTRVPGGHAALRGIAGFRGALIPVYDLARLLGQPDAEAPRWLVIAAAAPVALAFQQFEGQLRAAPDEILPQAGRADTAAYARDVVRTADFVGPIMHVPSVLDAIKASRTRGAPAEE